MPGSPTAPPPTELHHYAGIGPSGRKVGYASRGSGPLVLLLHGFPDTHRGFLPAMERLAAEGFHAVAPEPRGYAPTDIPDDGDYRVETFAQDVLDLADALGAERFCIVGHDWGALTACATANLAPARVLRMVTAGVPHTAHFLLAMRLRQLVRSSYMLRFQIPAWPERRIRRDDFAWLEALIRSWSPGWNFGEAEMRPLKDNYAQPGRLEAALSYYRQLPRSLLHGPSRRLIFGPVAAPTRMVYGTRDGCIGADMFQGQRKWFRQPLDLIAMQGAGHFMQWEQPDAFARLVADFLRVDGGGT